jgi:quercetin dioxygenase-like cupin family protein
MLTDRETAPRHETPNAVMRTLAAPSLGARELAVWEVSMQAGQRGPVHSTNREQVWTVIEGQLDVELSGERRTVCGGATLRIPADAVRCVTAALRTRAVVASPAGCLVKTGEAEVRPLPWAQ